MAKLNCWEVKKCGREVGGANAAELGVCPAARCPRLEGVHGGGKVQGTFARKFTSCLQCEFYRLVRQEEGPAFEKVDKLVDRLGG